MSPRSVNSLIKKIKAQQDRIGRERDKLRDLVDEAEAGIEKSRFELTAALVAPWREPGAEALSELL